MAESLIIFGRLLLFIIIVLGMSLAERGSVQQVLWVIAIILVLFLPGGEKK